VSEMFAFDSTGMDPDKAFAQYRELYASGTDVERLPVPFHARVRSWRLDRSLLFAREYGGIRHIRDERVARDGFDHFVLHHVVSGEMRGGPIGKPITVKAGETLLLDTRRAMEGGATSVSLVTISLAREAMLAAIGSAEDLHGYRIGVREGALLGSLLRELVAQASHLLPGAHAAITRTLVDLLSVAVHPAGATGRSDFYRQDHVRREAVRRVIETHIATADFSVQEIIGLTGLSRASLYRLFEPQGGVARFIQLCRLQHLRGRLDDRACDGQAIAELAPQSGFSGESHAGRLFKQVFGVSPGVYRAASIRGAQAPSVEAMSLRWDSSLLHELR
jgi:AraC-like DNA-binding protein